ncbi:MAG: hypothetical protein CMI60_17180 [Parvibaculum sp.]|jgi:hypothetical protein|nr:hypothetical protein [Parvibaculum sp.]|tara:strand:+ start:1760 stop:1963 length:204 start_codon:yes stop_codon:yes gene_type:complete
MSKSPKLQEIGLPVTVEELLELLNKLYPERSPDLDDDTKAMYFKAGQRDVVRFLNVLKERSEDNILE